MQESIFNKLLLPALENVCLQSFPGVTGIIRFEYGLSSLWLMKRISKTKVVRLPAGHFHLRKQRPLSKLMIATLLTAYRKQEKGISFGQADIDGSFSSLVSRGLIKHKKGNGSSGSWFVTEEAFEMLHKLGNKITT